MGRYTPRARWGPDQRACQPWGRTREVVSGGVFRGTREDAEGNHDASGVPWQRHTPFVGGDHRANGGAACGQRGARVRPRGGSRVWWAPWIQRPSRVRRPPCVPRDWTILGTVLGSLCLPPRWSWRPLLRSMSNRPRRELPPLLRYIGTIVTTRRATTRMSSSALVAGDRSSQPHRKAHPVVFEIWIFTLKRGILLTSFGIFQVAWE